jgi:hypothetical protein
MLLGSGKMMTRLWFGSIFDLQKSRWNALHRFRKNSFPMLSKCLCNDIKTGLLWFYGLLSLSEIATLIYFGLGDVLITTNAILSFLLNVFGMYSFAVEHAFYMQLFSALAVLALIAQWTVIFLFFYTSVFSHYNLSPDLIQKLPGIVYPSMIAYTISVLIALYFVRKLVNRARNAIKL